MKQFLACFLVGFFLLGSSFAWAGEPSDWQLGFQQSGSPVMEDLAHFHHFLLYIIFSIAIVVMVLLVYVMWRFRAGSNPKPSKTSHHTLLEIIWTVIPVIILVIIVVPSLRLLYRVNHIENADMTLKVIGYQWYWGYQYPDYEDLGFESNMVPFEELGPQGLRLLEVNNRVVLPVDTTVRIQVTAADVIHSWAVPSLGVKIDAVPGRLNETWVRIDKPGVYYGQCSELCGVNHGFMPVVIQAVTKEEFDMWLKEAEQKFSLLPSSGDTSPMKVALHHQIH